MATEDPARVDPVDDDFELDDPSTEWQEEDDVIDGALPDLGEIEDDTSEQ